MFNEYLKAVPLLTISNEERLKFRLEQRITIERTQLESLKADFEKFKKEVMKKRKQGQTNYTLENLISHFLGISTHYIFNKWEI